MDIGTIMLYNKTIFLSILSQTTHKNRQKSSLIVLFFCLLPCIIEHSKGGYQMDTIKIGEFLKALRKAKGYTQEEVANHLMLSPKTISRWENGVGIPDINIISAVADFYNVTVDEILKGERQTQFSEQTSKLKNESKVKVIMNNITRKYNVYFISSLSVIGATLLLAIIFGFTVHAVVAIFLMLLGIIIGGLIIIIANSEVKRVLADNSEDCLEEGIDKTNREIRRNVMFLDIFVTATIIDFFIFYLIL